MDNMVATFICLGIGLLLFIGEMFTPGLGAMGALGTIALFAAVMLQINNPVGILFMIALVLFIVAVALLIFFRLATKGKFDKSHVILSERIDGNSNSLKESSFQQYVGSTGVALTALRPAGKAEFDGKILDVVTGGEFLPKGAQVQVLKAEGLRILVRAVVVEE